MSLSSRLRRLLSTFAIVGLFAAPSFAGAPAGGAQSGNAQAGGALAGLSRADAEAVLQAEAAIEKIDTMRARFTQVAPDGGLSEGTVYLRRPGRVRFEYEPPSPYLVVADGVWLVVIDKELEQLNRFPVYETPLGPLLAEHVDLEKKARVTRVLRGNGLLKIAVVDRERPDDGELTLVFEAPHLLLREWQVRDAQGGVTTVTLSDPEFHPKLKPELFVATDSILAKRSNR